MNVHQENKNKGNVNNQFSETKSATSSVTQNVDGKPKENEGILKRIWNWITGRVKTFLGMKE